MSGMTPEKKLSERIIEGHKALDRDFVEVFEYDMERSEIASAVQVLEAHVDALGKALRETCWHAYEGYNDLTCALCDARAEDGKGQEYLDTKHNPGCLAAVLPVAPCDPEKG